MAGQCEKAESYRALRKGVGNGNVQSRPRSFWNLRQAGGRLTLVGLEDRCLLCGTGLGGDGRVALATFRKDASLQSEEALRRPLAALLVFLYRYPNARL